MGLPPEGAEGAPWQREALPAAEGGTAARSAAPSDRPPEILISSQPSNTDPQKHGYTLHGAGSIRVDGNNPQG